jgi:tetratricopeptide (TPR) repeat protein
LSSEALAHAQAAHAAGDLAAAEQAYRGVAAEHADFAEALIGLATIELQRANPDEALRLAEEARDRRPGSAQAHATVGAALQVLRRHEASAAAFEAALAADPDQPEAYFGLGSAIQALGRDEEALACFDRALAIDPDYPEAACARAGSLASLGRHAAACDGFAAALEMNPDFIEARCGLAASLAALDQPRDAEREFERALESDPDYGPAHAGLARLLREQSRPREAIPHFSRLAAMRPDDIELMLSLGETLEESGDIAEALKLFEQAAARAPRSPRAIYALFQGRRAEAGDPLSERLLELSSELPRMSRQDRILVHFSLAKALAELGEPGRGFNHLIQGNALRREAIDYDEPRVLGVLGRVPAVFSGPPSQAEPAPGAPALVPIFVVGMPRSGSTLIEQVLASHPSVVAAGERKDFLAAMRAAGLEGSPGGRSYPDSVASSTPAAIGVVGRDYLRRLAAAAGGAGWATDKTPANFLVVGLIHMAIPGARVIHSLRDPIDTCLSCFATLFAADQPFAFDLGELGRYYAAYDRVMAHWRRVLPPEAMIEVRYEDMVADLEGQARRILDYCGLPWDPAVLDFHRSDRPVRTASLRQVRQPIYRSSVGRWRPDETVLRPLTEALTVMG